MTAKYFGTDGIRDAITGPLLSSDFCTRFGAATGQFLKSRHPGKSLHVAIGRDTRDSGQRIFMDLARGLESEDIKVFDAGIVPTPGLAEVVSQLDLNLGIVITASHNPATDNGIKLFGPGGFKLSTDEELELEGFLDEIGAWAGHSTREPPVFLFDGKRHYLAARQRVIPENALLGLRIVVDCANGATYATTPDMLNQLGASVISIGNNPDGSNINREAGSEHTGLLAQTVCEQDAHLGIAHDGDGDRLILCDHRGKIVDGDAILAVLGTAWANSDRLPGNRLVATIMSNLGLDQCLARANVSCHRSEVGDRNVFFDMKRLQANLGGESSGHFIALSYAPTGDGLLSALLIMEQIYNTGKMLDELVSIYEPLPQLKQNLHLRQKEPLDSLQNIKAAEQSCRNSLGNRGRLLVRYSGTETKIRILVEADDEALAQANLDKLLEAVHQDLDVIQP